MHPRWLDRVLVIGAALLAVLGVTVGAAAGVPALFPANSSNKTDGNVIALVLGQTEGGAWGWVETDAAIDPTRRDTVVLRFWVSSTEPGAASFILGGPMVQHLRHCYGSGTQWDETPISFATLSDEERSAIVRYHQYAPTQGLLEAERHSQVMSQADAQALSSAQTYARISSTSSRTDTRSYTPGTSPTVTVEARAYDFRCSFEPDAFWSTQQGQHAFTFPTVTESVDYETTENYRYLSRLASFIKREAVSVTALNDPADYSKSGTTDFRSLKAAYNGSGPTTLVLNQFVAVFKDESEDSNHQMQLLVVGGVLALLGTLTLALGRRLSEATTAWMQTLRTPKARGKKS